MTEKLAAEIVRQLLSTMVYLHSKGFIYGNLSPKVVMLDPESSLPDGNINIKLVDLDIQSAISASTHSVFWTPTYFQAPEVLESRMPTEKQDVWATGVLLTTLLTGKTPHES